MKKKARFRLDWPDEDDEYDESEEGSCPEPEVEGPSYAPMFTGLFKEDGTPILRHPVVMRMGFHTEARKYYCPTLEEGEFGEADGKVFGWVYD